MMFTTFSVLIAGNVPVFAMISAPSSLATNFTKSRAASCFLDALLTPMLVIVPSVVPAGTPSGCGYFTIPQFLQSASPALILLINVPINHEPMFIMATLLL